MDEIENFFCQFPNPWALRVSGMGGYTSKCEKKSKSLHLTGHTVTLRSKIENSFYKDEETFTVLNWNSWTSV